MQNRKVVENQALRHVSKLGGSGELSSICAAMNHESSVWTGLSARSAEESDDTRRRDLPSVIQRQFNGYSAEEVVEEHTVTNVSPSSLEKHMNMLHRWIGRALEQSQAQVGRSSCEDVTIGQAYLRSLEKQASEGKK